MGCERPPTDAAAKHAAARARLEAAVGPFPTEPAGGEAGARLLVTLRPLAAEDPDRPLLRRLARTSVEQWASDDASALTKYLSDRETAMAEARLAAGTEPSGLGLPVPPPADDTFAEIRPLLSSVRLLTLDGRVAIARSDELRAMEDARAISRILHAAYGEPWLITHLLAGAAERMAFSFVADAIEQGDHGTLDVFRQGLLRLDEIPALAWVAGEALLVERNFASQIKGSPSEEELLEEAYSDAIAAMMLERDADLVAAAAGGSESFRVWAEQLRREAAKQSKMDPARWVRHWIPRGLGGEDPIRTIAAIVCCGPIDEAEKVLGQRTARHLAVLAITVEASGRQDGSLPATIEEQAAAFRNEYTSERPIYELRPDGSASLTLRRALESWRERFGTMEMMPPGFEWEIPAPRAQASNEKRTAPASRPRS